MTMRLKLSRVQAAALLHGVLATGQPVTKKEACKKAGLTSGQFRSAYELLQDSLSQRGTPINVSRSHPYTYSIPRPIDHAESLYYNLRRQAIITNTSLRRLQEHAVAGRDYHPHKTDEFDEIIRVCNRSRKTISRIVPEADQLEIES